jgi:hypothetical protein
LPCMVRTVTPQRVAHAVIRAIERDIAETVVAPTEMRLAIAIGALAPRASARVQALAGINLGAASSNE